jgi:hypothetical protein
MFVVHTHPVVGIHPQMMDEQGSGLQSTGVKTHPLTGSQMSVVQVLLSLQTIGVWTQAPVHVLHVSVVQTLLSLQSLGVYVQAPVVASQVSTVQGLVSAHLGA